MKPIASNDLNQTLGPRPEKAAGTISRVAVLRDARILRQSLRSALRRTRLIVDIDMIHTMETQYYSPRPVVMDSGLAASRRPGMTPHMIRFSKSINWERDNHRLRPRKVGCLAGTRPQHRAQNQPVRCSPPTTAPVLQLRCERICANLCAVSSREARMSGMPALAIVGRRDCRTAYTAYADRTKAPPRHRATRRRRPQSRGRRSGTPRTAGACRGFAYCRAELERSLGIVVSHTQVP